MNPKILIVEDDKSISTCVSMLIGHKFNNAKVDVADRVEKAHEFLKKQNYDLIVLDHFVPGGNAPAVLDFIQNNPTYKRSVIYFSCSPVSVLNRDVLFKEKYWDMFRCVIEKPDRDNRLLKEIHSHFFPPKQFESFQLENKSLKQIAREQSVDVQKAGKIIRKMHGRSFTELSQMMKLKKTKRLLDMNLTTKQTAEQVGMSPKKLPTFFKQQTGETPTEYKKRKRRGSL